MDGGDVWRVMACGGDGARRDNRIINRIMLKFRPIAPKPVAGASVPAGTVLGNRSNLSVPGKRAKRKYVRVRRNSGCMRKNNNKSEKFEKRDNSKNNSVVTLQLMPEKAETEQLSLAGVSWCKNVDLDVTVEKIQILDNRERPIAEANAVTGKGLDQATAVVESWVTVESVTDTCMDAEGLGSTDVEKVNNLERDTCPGFVSDGYGRVRWVNDAYKRLVMSEENCSEGQASPEIVVRLKLKDNVVWCYSHTVFTCGVRLQYTWRNEKCTKTVPCDVWRLECGGFAWRLDVKTALSLAL